MNNEKTFEEAIELNGLKMDIEAVMKERDELREALEKEKVERQKVVKWWLSEQDKNKELEQKLQERTAEIQNLREIIENVSAESGAMYADKKYNQGRAEGMLEIMAVMFGGE